MRYYLIAGERSGDLHGGNLIKELRKQDEQAVFRGFGGGKMKEAGAELAVHYDQMAFMGFVTLIANFIPDQSPGNGPHYFKFDDTVLYEIKIDNTGDGVEDISYQFNFSNQVKNPDTVLGMAAPNEALAGKGGIDPLISSNLDPDYNEFQTYSITRVDRSIVSTRRMLATQSA